MNEEVRGHFKRFVVVLCCGQLPDGSSDDGGQVRYRFKVSVRQLSIARIDENPVLRLFFCALISPVRSLLTFMNIIVISLNAFNRYGRPSW